MFHSPWLAVEVVRFILNAIKTLGQNMHENMHQHRSKTLKFEYRNTKMSYEFTVRRDDALIDRASKLHSLCITLCITLLQNHHYRLT